MVNFYIKSFIIGILTTYICKTVVNRYFIYIDNLKFIKEEYKKDEGIIKRCLNDLEFKTEVSARCSEIINRPTPFNYALWKVYMSFNSCLDIDCRDLFNNNFTYCILFVITIIIVFYMNKTRQIIMPKLLRNKKSDVEIKELEYEEDNNHDNMLFFQ